MQKMSKDILLFQIQREKHADGNFALSPDNTLTHLSGCNQF